MNLKEYAAKSGITISEAKKQTGLTHWNQTVPEILEADVELIETESKEDIELIELSIRGAGTKSPYWDKRHLIGRE